MFDENDPRRSGLAAGESPFLAEALEELAPPGPPEEVARELASVSRRLSGGARALVERARLRHLADAGLDEAESPFLASEEESPFLAAEAEEGESLGETYEAESVERFEYDIAEPPIPRAAAGRDASVAVPPFPAAERGRIGALLPPARHSRAATANAKLHPARSGITVDALRVALKDYVDLDAVARAIADHDRGARDGMIGSGSSAFDPVLVQAIHAFQAKCYLKPGAADGIAGASTLDSLGLIRHGLPKEDATNATAKGVLQERAAAVKAATGGEFSAEHWFQDFVAPAFLGHGFTHGVHPLLVRALRVAERHLLGMAAYSGMTPVALGKALGFTATRETHAGGRPKIRAGGVKYSYHGYGLAIDVRYLANPWIAGNPEARGHGKPDDADYVKGGNRWFIEVAGDAALLMLGQPVQVDSPYLDRLGGKPTAEVVATLRRLSDAFRAYLALAKDPGALRRKLEERRGTAGVLESGETLDQAAGRWSQRIERQLSAIDHKGNFVKRDPRVGFFDLPSDLVVALRDHAHLAWGAVDIGGNQSGDLMHFDLRLAEIGKAIRPGAPISSRGSRPAPRAPKPTPKPKPTAEPEPARSRVDPPGETLYGRMAIQTSKTTSQVGIFVPEKFRARPQVDLVVYLHGLLGPCGSPTNGMAGYWDTGLARPGQHPGTGPMALRESLNASRKSAILVAPSLGRGSEAGALTSRGGFDALVDKTLEAVGRDSHLAVKPTSVGQIVLSGHSKGGSHMRRIVAAGDSMAERIRECWGFDCMYGGADPEAWKAWAAADTKRRRFFHYYLVGRDKKGNKLVPWYHNEILRGLAKDAGLRNVTLEHAQGFNHCQVPMAYFRKRLEESDFLDNA